jgi:hypothetical protein
LKVKLILGGFGGGRQHVEGRRKDKHDEELKSVLLLNVVSKPIFFTEEHSAL